MSGEDVHPNEKAEEGETSGVKHKKESEYDEEEEFE